MLLCRNRIYGCVYLRSDEVLNCFSIMSSSSREEIPDAGVLEGSVNPEYFHFSEPLKLKRLLSLWDGVGMIVGTMIGSGIFLTPLTVVSSAGSVGFALIVWLLCGLLTFCGALCYTELGTSIPKSGSEFVYLGEAFGGLCAFCYLWVTLLITTPTVSAIDAMTFAQYVLYPFVACEPPDLTVKLLATVVVSHVGNLSQPFWNTSYRLKDIAFAFYFGMYSFSGWFSLNSVTEELKKPVRNLPRAVYISVPLVTLLYFFTNLAYFAVISREEILSSHSIIVMYGDKTLGRLNWILLLSVAVSSLGSLNGDVFFVSRVFFVGGRQGYLPNAVGMISIKHLTPSPSLILMVNTALPVSFLMIGILTVLLPFFKNTKMSFIAVGIIASAIPVYFIFVYWGKKPHIVARCLNAGTRFVQKLLLCSPQERKTTCEEEVQVIDKYLQELERRSTASRFEMN